MVSHKRLDAIKALVARVSKEAYLEGNLDQNTLDLQEACLELVAFAEEATTLTTGADNRTELLMANRLKVKELEAELDATRHHDPELCPTWYDKCNCSLEVCVDALDRAEHYEVLLKKLSNLRAPPVTKEDYVSRKILVSDIFNNAAIMLWMHRYLPTEDLREVRSAALLGDNRENFRKLFGKADWHFKGSEFYFHVWVRHYKNTTILLLTAKDKGTCYEVVEVGADDWRLTNVQREGQEIIEFLGELHASLLALQTKP
jgi:hypothetical protein